jgi:glycosyltransferase involved in cell wall biosynthesis
MQITIVTPLCQPSEGDVRAISLHLKHLLQLGHKIHVIALPEKPANWTRRIKDSLSLKFQAQLHPSRSLNFEGLDIAVSRILSWRPVTEADVPDADIIIGTTREAIPWISKLPSSKGAKVYFTLDYVDPACDLNDLIPIWNLPVHTITIAEWLKTFITLHSFKKEEDVMVVPNGIDLSLYPYANRQRNKEFRLGYIHYNIPSKGSEIIFKTMKLVKENDLPFHCVALGDPFPNNRYSEYIEHLGNYNQQLALNTFCSCDAWLFPSRQEGFGLSMLEAMACGTPVIGTRTGIAPEALPSGGGILLSSPSANAFLDAIIKFNNMDDEAWCSASLKARAKAEEYSWVKSGERLDRELKRLLSSQADPQKDSLLHSSGKPSSS